MDMTTKPVESSAIPPELMAELQEAVEQGDQGHQRSRDHAEGL